MEHSEPEVNPEGQLEIDDPPPIGRPPRLLRIRLWQAIAGMSVAVTLALLIVTSELATSLARRTNYVNRRVAAMNAIVRDLRRQTAVTQRKLGSERERATVGEVFEKILFAPDLRTIKLAAPAEKDKEKDKSSVQSGGVEPASGRLAMSESAGGAMLEASGLKPTGPFQVYRIWWMPRRGVPIWAADFLVGDDGLATVPVDLPPGRRKEPALSVTLENESYSEAPTGPIALRGEGPAVSSTAPGSHKLKQR
jgi:hypothetical protein